MTDRNGNQDSDTVYVRIEDLGPETFQIPPAAHPVVNYPEGAEAFLENTRVTPDGSGSNDSLDNGRIVSYLWEQIGLTGGTLSNDTSSRATFTTYRFRLTVTDNKNLTHTAEVTVRVKAAPMAEAGEKPGGPGKGHHHAAGQRHRLPRGDADLSVVRGTDEPPGAPTLILQRTRPAPRSPSPRPPA